MSKTYDMNNIIIFIIEKTYNVKEEVILKLNTFNEFFDLVKY